VVTQRNRTERTADVTDVRLVKHRGTAGACNLSINCGH
jgi:hypothetical protein